MANDDDYDFSGVSQSGPFDIDSSVLSQWRAQNDEEEDDDHSYFWPEQLPYDIEEKLREINKVHEEDETPIESDRPRKIAFNSRVQMRAISMRRIPPQAESSNNDEPFDLSKYDTDESVDDVETSITAPRETAKAPPEAPRSTAHPLPVPTASSSRNPAAAGSAGQQRQRFVNKTAVSRIGHVVPKSPGGVSTSGFTAKGGSAGAARRGFRDSQNFQLPDGLVSDRLSVLSLTDEEDDDACVVVGSMSSDTGYSSSAAAGDAPGPQPAADTPARPQQAPVTALPATPAVLSASANAAAPSSLPISTPTSKSVSVPASQPSSSPVTLTVSKTASVSVPASKPVPVSTSAPKLTPAVTSAPTSLSKSVSTSVSVSKSAPSSVSVPKPASVAPPVSASAPKPVVPLSASVSTPAPKLLPASASAYPSVEPASDRAPPASSAPTHCSETRPVSGTDDGALPETIRKIWPQMVFSSEGYQPSWSETPHQAPTTYATSTARAAHNQVSNQQTDSNEKLSDATETNGRQGAETAKPCACQSEPGKLCRCEGESAVPSCGNNGIRKDQLTSTKSEDSALESMDDHTSYNTAESSTDGSIGNAAEPSRSAPDQSYATIHLSRLGRNAQAQVRGHEFTITKSPSTGATRPRLTRSSSAGRPPEGRRSVSGGGSGPDGHLTRPRASSGSDRRPCSSPDRAADRPRSAPVRSVVSAPALPRRQPSAQRAGQQVAGQSAGASPPPRRRRARSQDPSLTFQQWLQQHEKERAQAVQDRKNNAKKRKQEANIKQEKAPQAFRVWLRKKRQQQLMEQRVQQLRQQQDVFRQWLARKQRERTATGRGPPQATLRSLSALYHMGRPRPVSAASRPPTAAPAAGDRHTPPHSHLHHIYGPHVSRGHRCRSAHIPGA